MHPTVKKLICRAYDIVTLPFTFLSALHLWRLRKCGLACFPRARQTLLRRGVFPIRRHFYEPLFHPDDLHATFGQERALPGIDMAIEGQLTLLKTLTWQNEVRRFADRSAPVLNNGTTFDIDNPNFHPGDIDVYYQLIRRLRPHRVIEVGSGYSTIVGLSALEQCKREDPSYTFEMHSIEPYPWFQHPDVHPVKARVEDVDLPLFSGLQAGDVLFIDSSHMLRPCGDVEHEYLRILPSLQPGVYIHIHDVFTPFNYPDTWVKRSHIFWNEQYVLEAMLSGGKRYEVVAALHYLSRTYPEQARQAMPLLTLRDTHPQSFWIRKT